MSIATEARVAELEKEVAELKRMVGRHDWNLTGWRNAAGDMGFDGGPHSVTFALRDAIKRIEELERTAARKPGPKPKESNG
jgi:hypothetical protein